MRRCHVSGVMNGSVGGRLVGMIDGSDKSGWADNGRSEKRLSFSDIKGLNVVLIIE